MRLQKLTLNFSSLKILQKIITCLEKSVHIFLWLKHFEVFIHKSKLLRNSVLFYIIVFTPFGSGLPVHSPQTSQDKTLKEFEKHLQKNSIPLHHIGIIVADANKILYQLNAHQSFIPASLIKLFTASALLELLSPSLKFTTHFMAKNKIKDSVLKGDLYLKGGGDPSFVSESLWNLVNNLKRTGLKTIEGDLIVDDSRFDRKIKGERLPQPSHSSYDAPVGALSFNWNTANIYLRPGKKRGDPVTVIVDPSPLYFANIENHAKTKKTKKRNIFIQRQTQNSRESLKISGSLPLWSPEILIYRNILRPAIWTGWNTLSFLKQRGIHVTGNVKKGEIPNKAIVLAEWKSKPLTDHVKLMMKYSNNFMVEMLVKNMVVELMGKIGNLKDGLQIIKKHLKHLGIKPQEYTMIQASGLSRKNKITPYHLLKVLKYWINHPLQPEFESALPIAGEDGTLKKYFKKSELKGYIHAKTGSINGVTGLAGYLATKKEGKKMFVFLFNGPVASQQKAEMLFRKWAYIISSL